MITNYISHLSNHISILNPSLTCKSLIPNVGRPCLIIFLIALFFARELSLPIFFGQIQLCSLRELTPMEAMNSTGVDITAANCLHH